MIVKFFPNKGGGSPSASMDYLLGKDRERVGAAILSGDPELSLAISESTEFKQSYTVGCLSFEERTITPKAKAEIMQKFEETIFAGLEQDQYNITWIEHTDKNRIELNFYIPKVELSTGKSLQPYYDRADRYMVDAFTTVVNYEYGLTDPKDPSKAQTIKTHKDTPKQAKEIKEDLGTFFVNAVADGQITDRKQIIDLLNDSGYEIARTTGKSISIKNPEGGRNIRLEGSVFGEELYEQISQGINAELGEVVREQEARYRANRKRVYERAGETLAQAVGKRSEQNRANYPIKELASDISHSHSDDRRLNRSILSNPSEITQERSSKFEASQSDISRVRGVSRLGGLDDMERGRENLSGYEAQPKSKSLRPEERRESSRHRRVSAELYEEHRENYGRSQLQRSMFYSNQKRLIKEAKKMPKTTARNAQFKAIFANVPPPKPETWQGFLKSKINGSSDATVKAVAETKLKYIEQREKERELQRERESFAYRAGRAIGRFTKQVGEIAQSWRNAYGNEREAGDRERQYAKTIVGAVRENQNADIAIERSQQQQREITQVTKEIGKSQDKGWGMSR